ncbi:MAG: restriction endonuclease subunit M, partial [Phototrophicales bacterium]
MYILKNLGKLPADFDGTIFRDYLKHSNSDMRFWAVKNIGKLNANTFADDLFQIACHDEDSMVRREAVSSLGRMRDENLIRHLIYLLADRDAKVVLQAMRALLVFKHKPEVVEALRFLEQHENEQIQMVMRREFSQAHDVTDYGTHTTAPDFMKNTAVLGDVRQVLEYVPDGAIHLTFTSPPYYNARDYSIYSSYEG